MPMNKWAAATKAIAKINKENVSQHPTGIPHVCNNESVASVNAANTGVVDLIKADASDVVTLPNGATVPVGKTITYVTGGINYAEVALTNAEIKALRAAPKTLVAAPGAGKVLEFVGATLLLDYGTNALTESSDDLAVKYTDGSGTAVSAAITSNGFVTATADTMIRATPATAAAIAKSACENKALVLHNTGDGELGGNAANDTTMRVKVAYRVHSTGW
jgi:hypothetical protein